MAENSPLSSHLFSCNKRTDVYTLSLPLSFHHPSTTHPHPTHTHVPKQQTQAVIDYKFRTFGRAVLTTEAAVHFLLLMVFSSYLLAVCAVHLIG